MTARSCTEKEFCAENKAGPFVGSFGIVIQTLSRFLYSDPCRSCDDKREVVYLLQEKKRWGRVSLPVFLRWKLKNFFYHAFKRSECPSSDEQKKTILPYRTTVGFWVTKWRLYTIQVGTLVACVPGSPWTLPWLLLWRYGSYHLVPLARHLNQDPGPCLFKHLVFSYP